MTETEVKVTLVAHLRERGWDVTTENADFTDVIARRVSELLVAEVKGHTSDAGTDLDIGYGQLLRRMTDANADATFVLAVPESLRTAAARVPARVRDAVGIEVWLVPDVGPIHPLDG
jgi:hypothetical protein